MVSAESLITYLDAYRRKAVLDEKKAVELVLTVDKLSSIIYGLRLSLSVDDAIDEEIRIKRELKNELSELKKEKK